MLRYQTAEERTQALRKFWNDPDYMGNMTDDEKWAVVADIIRQAEVDALDAQAR